MVDCWEILGIAPTEDLRAIKKAYARLLKQNRPEDDMQAFSLLRDAFETACETATHQQANPAPRQLALATRADAAVALSTAPSPSAPPQTHQLPPPEEKPRRTQRSDARQRQNLHRAAFDPSVDRHTVKIWAEQYGWLDLVDPPPGLPRAWLSRAHGRVLDDMAATAISDLDRRWQHHGHFNADFAFEQLLEDPCWDRIDARPVLAGHLAQYLAQCVPFPDRLAQRVADWAHWDLDASAADSPLAPALQKIRERLAAARRYRERAARAAQGVGRHDDLEALALAIVFGVQPLNSHLWLRQSLPLRRAVAAAYAALPDIQLQDCRVEYDLHLHEWMCDTAGFELEPGGLRALFAGASGAALLPLALQLIESWGADPTPIHLGKALLAGGFSYLLLCLLTASALLAVQQPRRFYQVLTKRFGAPQRRWWESVFYMVVVLATAWTLSSLLAQG